MAAMSALVFCGVYAIGNPIDVLISPEATQAVRDNIIAQYGLDKPLWKQYFGFVERLMHDLSVVRHCSGDVSWPDRRPGRLRHGV